MSEKKQSGERLAESLKHDKNTVYLGPEQMVLDYRSTPKPQQRDQAAGAKGAAGIFSRPLPGRQSSLSLSTVSNSTGPAPEWREAEPARKPAGFEKPDVFEKPEGPWSLGRLRSKMPGPPRMPAAPRLEQPCYRETPIETAKEPAKEPAPLRELECALVSPEGKNCFFDLANLIANITEAHSVAIFKAEPSSRTLRMLAHHTLSRGFQENAVITYGAGLVGWTAENAVRISVCPFENDAATLLYYSCDQELKSFIGVPILGPQNQMLGVIACDSKRSYAFAKLTEKILMDCAKQCAHLMRLEQAAETTPDVKAARHNNVLSSVLDQLRSIEEEAGLLTAATEMPAELVERDALVVVTAAEGGVGAGRYFPNTFKHELEHRLLQTVCKHKKVLVPARSVHSMPVDDFKHRSFLSIPFRVLGVEAGSINLLSKPRHAFDSTAIAALEKIAHVLGMQLEAIRLREKAFLSRESDALLTWKQFGLLAKTRLTDARKARSRQTLLRLSFQGLPVVERLAGVDGACEISGRVGRLLSQVVRTPAVACALYGLDYLVLIDTSEVDGFLSRFDRLLARLGGEDMGFKEFGKLRASGDLSAMLRSSLLVSAAVFPDEGDTISALAERCRQGLNFSDHSGSDHSGSDSSATESITEENFLMGARANAGSK